MSEKNQARRDHESFTRRDFLQTTGAGAAAALVAGMPMQAALAKEAATPSAETHVKLLYASLNEKQRQAMCFDWDHVAGKRGVLRTHISNNWRITKPGIKTDFYTKDQQALIRKVFEGMLNPDWIERFDKQLQDDMGGFGKAQSIAIFGKPDEGKFEFVLSGRHLTLRCDGNTTEHVAFGSPIVYGHAASGYHEKPAHPGNVFWHQAKAANEVYQMLDDKHRRQALQPAAPDEALIAFQGKKGKFPGVPIKEMSADQKTAIQGVLHKLVEPFRKTDREEVLTALKSQGGLNECSLVFYRKDDLGDDGLWDNWRIEGPAFVWHYRGAPHVHVWVNVSDDPSVATNSKNLSGPLRK
ncbi:MAG: DUF3500 domain-containing protein [Planctomycetales bacterium]